MGLGAGTLEGGLLGERKLKKGTLEVGLHEAGKLGDGTLGEGKLEVGELGTVPLCGALSASSSESEKLSSVPPG